MRTRRVFRSFLPGCGTSPALSARSGDDGGKITVGTGATGCVLTFLNAYAGAMSPVIVVPSGGAALPVYTYSTAAITFTSVTAGAVY
jgi:hypothetical protein